MKKFLICSFFIFFALSGYWILDIGYSPRLTWGAAPSELKNSIDQKTQELLEITNQIKENQKSLEETQGQSKTLQQEVKKIDSNINSVNLSEIVTRLADELNISNPERDIKWVIQPDFTG